MFTFRAITAVSVLISFIAIVAATDAESRARLQRNLVAWHHLSPDVRNRVRQIDKSLYEEDASTRQRLLGVAHRYTNWFNRLSDEDRTAISAAPAGPERIRAVRAVLDRQWFESLPKSFRDEYAAKPTERTALVEKWKTDDRERRNERADSLRDIELGIPGLPFGDKSFRDDVTKFVRDTLEPKLNEREKRRLANASRVNYYVQVASLSQAHGLRPPGPPEAWRKLADRKPRIPPPE